MKSDTKSKETKNLKAKLKLKRAQEKEESEGLNSKGIFGTKYEPRKSLAVYLRNQNKIEVSLISILDKKAAILIKISTTIVSASIFFHKYLESNVINGHLLSHILLGGLMISLILSILATKPFSAFYRRMYEKEVLSNHPTLAENNFIFDGTSSLMDYELSMKEVIKSQDLQIGNQVRANYLIAKNNRYKSRLIDLAYTFFLMTFVVAAIVFSFSRFHH